MSNTPIAQIAASTIKGTEKRNIYPKTIDKAVLTTDKEGNENTLDKVLIKDIKVNGTSVTMDTDNAINLLINMIQSIVTEESSVSGGTNTVTINLSDGTSETFNILNGKDGLISIEKTSTTGLVDLYTITYSDGTTSTFTVTNGVGFSSVSSPSTPDGTAIISLTNGDTITLDLNHNHSDLINSEGQTFKFYICDDETEYEGITTKDEDTLYLIPEETAST